MISLVSATRWSTLKREPALQAQTTTPPVPALLAVKELLKRATFREKGQVLACGSLLGGSISRVEWVGA